MWILLTNAPTNSLVQAFSQFSQSQLVDFSILTRSGLEEVIKKARDTILFWPIVDCNSPMCFNLVFKTLVQVSKVISYSGTKLVLFSSPLPIQPVPGLEYAAATLAACEGLMESLAVEVENFPLIIDIGLNPTRSERLFNSISNTITTSTDKQAPCRVVVDESKSKEIIRYKLRSWLEELEDWKFMTTDQ